MADPKYADLPGIVYDQPDIYESNELPESEQDYFEPENLESSAVEVLHISSADAHSRFKDRVLDSTHIDFSDRISRGRRTGYCARRVEWELESDKEQESVVHKYQRLKCEAEQLFQEMQEIKGDIEYGDGKISAAELNKQVQSLHSTLVGLNIKDALGIDAMQLIDNLEDSGHEKILSLLEDFRKKAVVNQQKGDGKTSSRKVPSSEKTDSPPVSYELYYGPEHAKLTEMERAATLEKRLDKLESLVGNDAEKLSVLSTWTNHKSLMGAVKVLASRLSLLDPVHLDHIEGRLHAIHTRINQVADKKQATDDADKQSKINDLYELMKKSEVLCAALPEIGDRVVSIEDLHNEAAQFSQSLKMLDIAQTQLTSQLDTNSQLLATVQDKFSKNISNVASNIALLEERMQKLKK